jgi:hypothetical protein
MLLNTILDLHARRCKPMKEIEEMKMYAGTPDKGEGGLYGEGRLLGDEAEETPENQDYACSAATPLPLMVYDKNV